MISLRRFLAHLFLALWIFRVNRLAGWLSLQFYRLIYPQFRVGNRARIWGRFEVLMFPGGRIAIGDDLHLVSSSDRATTTLYSRGSFTAFPKGQIIIGDNVGLNGTVVTSKKRIEIGAGCMIAANTIIVDSDFHVKWPPESRLHAPTDQDDREVIIGKNVWIGMNTLVLKGVTIGDNTIIGAGSVVVKHIPANVIAAGNPARVLRALGPDVPPTGSI